MAISPVFLNARKVMENDLYHFGFILAKHVMTIWA